MKVRLNYVSNSSSSSFLVPKEPSGRISSIRLPREIWEAISRNHVEWNGEKHDMSSSDEWWLTEMVSDCRDEFNELSSMKGSFTYLDGHDMPYGCYDDEGEKNFIKFRKNGCDFYVLLSDFIGADGTDDIPDSVKLRNSIRTILESKLMNKSQKLDAISSLIDF
jgi:hypothetical protein